MRLRTLGSSLLLLSGLLLAVSSGRAEEKAPRHGRKYKAPPETSHIEVYVTKQATGKPVANAAVIFRATTPEGKNDGNLEVKTDGDGRAVIDVITKGSNVQVQVFANGLATFADTYQVNEASRTIQVALTPPQEQVSAYEDNSGKASNRTWGVQEPRTPPKPGTTPPVPTLKPGPKPGVVVPQPAATPGVAPAEPATEPAPKQ